MESSNQIQLFDAVSEAGLYHDSERFGFFSVLYKISNDKTEQRSYRLPKMAEVIQLLPKNRDTWISQAEFATPNRRIVNLAWLTSLFIDVDCYKVGIDPRKAEALLLLDCEEDRFPMPSIIISSGRGLQVKWFLDKPLPRHALPRWNAAQRALVDKFLHLGADPVAKDASRVLRLVETVNTKNGEIVHVSWVNTIKDGADVQSYDFDYLCEYLLPFTREQLAQMREDRRKKYEEHQQKKALLPKLEIIDGNSQAKRGFSNRQLAWHRLEDLRTLYKLRNGNIEGQSMPLLFWSLNFMLLSGATNPAQMFYEAVALCQEYGLGEFQRKGELSTLYAKAKQFEAGKMVEYNGNSYPALYTPRNSTLIDLFSITPDEQRQLRTIIGIEESKTRDRVQAEKRRREAGTLHRSAYLESHEQRRTTARLFRAQGRSWKEIAQECGYSSADTARKACS